MWVFRRFEKARFPQENEKNNRATLMRQRSWRSHKLISVVLSSGMGFATITTFNFVRTLDTARRLIFSPL